MIAAVRCGGNGNVSDRGYTQSRNPRIAIDWTLSFRAPGTNFVSINLCVTLTLHSSAHNAVNHEQSELQNASINIMSAICLSRFYRHRSLRIQAQLLSVTVTISSRLLYDPAAI